MIDSFVYLPFPSGLASSLAGTEHERHHQASTFTQTKVSKHKGLFTYWYLRSSNLCFRSGEKQGSTSEMAATRLRKTFKYSSDDEDSGGASRDEMDEEGRRTLIDLP